MASRGCSSSGCSSSSSSSAEEEAGGAADRMVKIELEAAEALADLATREAEAGGDSAGKWGSKGKRAMKRVKGESEVDCRFDSVPKFSGDRYEDQPLVDQQQHDRFSRDATAKPEQKARLQRPCSASHSSFGGGRSRQNLTEAEKEARKIRRILANRESARQTIRRRQALCEELAKKASDLSLENENLKREKELALKEYRSLETTNKDLKAQVTKATKAVVGLVEGTQGEGKSGQGHVPTSSPKSCSLLLYDRPPFTQLLWPAMIPSLNPSQSRHGGENPPLLPPNVPLPATTNPENLVNTNAPVTPIYLLPCPWFFPLPDHAHELRPEAFFCGNNKQEENSVSNQSSACISSKHVANLELNSTAFSTKAKAAVDDLNEPPVGCSENGSGSFKRAHSEETLLSLAPASCSSAKPATMDRHTESDSTANVESNSSTASRGAFSLAERSQEQDMHPCQKPIEAFAAAEARRRRKELTRLKNLHGRHFRTHS